MNYFEYHGSSIWDKKRKILEEATVWGDDIILNRYEKLANDKFVKSDFPSSYFFAYENKLYRFITDISGRISSFFQSAISKKDCLKKILVSIIKSGIKSKLHYERRMLQNYLSR